MGLMMDEMYGQKAIAEDWIARNEDKGEIPTLESVLCMV